MHMHRPRRQEFGMGGFITGCKLSTSRFSYLRENARRPAPRNFQNSVIRGHFYGPLFAPICNLLLARTSLAVRSRKAGRGAQDRLNLSAHGFRKSENDMDLQLSPPKRIANLSAG